MQSNSSSNYLLKLKDPRWQKKRLQIFDRDKWRCQICDDDKNTLHIHHLEYRGNIEPWDYSDDDLTTICENHHTIVSQCKIPREILCFWIENKEKFKELLPEDKYLRREKLDELFMNFIKNLIVELKELRHGKSTA